MINFGCKGKGGKGDSLSIYRLNKSVKNAQLKVAACNKMNLSTQNFFH